MSHSSHMYDIIHVSRKVVDSSRFPLNIVLDCELL